MMIVMKETATEKRFRQSSTDRGSGGVGAPIQGARVDASSVRSATSSRSVSVESLGLEGQPGVDRVMPILKPYKLASLQMTHGEHSGARDRGRKVGGDALRADRRPVHGRVARADCCSTAHDRHAMRRDAAARRRLQAAHLALCLPGPRAAGAAAACARPRRATGLPIVTELMDIRDLDAVLEVADVIQIGARNMQNYALLAEIGRSGRPALLKRGLSSTLDELLMAAEYILKEGNERRDPVRAGDPHVRARLPLHARSERDPGAQGDDPPAGDRRPEPRRRPA